MHLSGFQFARSWTFQSDFHRSLPVRSRALPPLFRQRVGTLRLQGEPTRRMELSIRSPVIINSESVVADSTGTDYDTRNTSILARYAWVQTWRFSANTGGLIMSLAPCRPAVRRPASNTIEKSVQVGLTFGHLLFRRWTFCPHIRIFAGPVLQRLVLWSFAAVGCLVVVVTFTPIVGLWANALAGPWFDPGGWTAARGSRRRGRQRRGDGAELIPPKHVCGDGVQGGRLS